MAFLREMSGLSGTASFESVESRFSFRCLRQGSVEDPRWLQKMASQILANVEEEWMMKRKGVPMDAEEGVHQICGFMWADNFGIMSHSKEHLEQMLKDLLEEAGKVDLEPKPASLWWTSTYASEDKSDMILGTSQGCWKISFEDEFRILGCAMNRQGKTCDAAENECSQQTRLSGRTLRYTRVRTFRGR